MSDFKWSGAGFFMKLGDSFLSESSAERREGSIFIFGFLDFFTAGSLKSGCKLARLCLVGEATLLYTLLYNASVASLLVTPVKFSRV